MEGEADRKLRRIASRLADFRPDVVETADPGAAGEGGLPLGPALASVALVVRPDRTDLQVLLIRRATVAGDPWSGHMALPGGRRSSRDADGRETAIRETMEEVGIDLLRTGTLLGRLDDVRPVSAAPRILVSPYVFAVPPATTTRANHEVDLAVWIPLEHLAGPGAATHYLHALASGERLRFPAIGFQEHVIWGLTYRIVSQFLAIARAAGAGGGR